MAQKTLQRPKTGPAEHLKGPLRGPLLYGRKALGISPQLDILMPSDTNPVSPLPEVSQ